MSKQLLLLITILSLAGFTKLHSQSDIEIFGFYQVKLSSESIDYKVTGDVPTQVGLINRVLGSKYLKNTTPNVQQLNLMFRKEFSSKVSTFINFEIVNDFSTDKNWGAFSLEELWLNYEYVSNHSIKGGSLIPKFNNLNEIKNRMPLLPYISRPIIYETSFRSTLDPSDFLPGRAFVQLQGKLYFNEFEFEYAAYAGAAENAYIAPLSGADTTNFKLYGGKIGFNYKNLRLGVSSTIDKKNLQSTLKENVDRVRLGFDLGFSFSGFTIDGELIKVFLKAKNTNNNIDKLFYYGTLQYDITEKIFTYGTYSYIEDKSNDRFFPGGLTNILLGGGYRASENIVLKFQYSTSDIDGYKPLIINPAIPPINAHVVAKVKTIAVACSVIF